MFDTVELFCRPASVREAVRLLQSGKGRARIVAGATDLMVEGDGEVRRLIDISGAGLRYIRRRGKSWAIGAATTMAEIEESTHLQKVARGVVCLAASKCGSLQIRNLATVGGNLANASPSADLAAVLLALDASVVVASPKGRTKMALADFLRAARRRHLRNTILVEVAFAEPSNGKHCGWSFQKFGRIETDISIVNATAGLELDARGKVKWARLVMGAVAPAPVRMEAAERMLLGRVLDQDALGDACAVVMRDVRPIDDVRAPAEYRRELSRVLAGRAIEDCAAQAGWML